MGPVASGSTTSSLHAGSSGSTPSSRPRRGEPGSFTTCFTGTTPGPLAEDMDVTPTREKKQTNMRSSTAEATEKLPPPTTLSLEQALEFIRQDECLEVTPLAVRPRKMELVAHARG